MAVAYIFFAEGFEESEALITSDMLCRAGITVIHVKVDCTAGRDQNSTSEQSNSINDKNNNKIVSSAHRAKIVCDIMLDEVNMSIADAIVFPGGLPGADNLASNEKIRRLIEQQLQDNKLVAAVCASPARVLGAQGFLKKRKFTCYPGEQKNVIEGEYIADADVVRSVVLDIEKSADRQDAQNLSIIITSQGVGTTPHFAYAITVDLVDLDTAKKVWDNALFSKNLEYPVIFG